jgi:putative hydrolase of the HAD superfamily
MVKKEEGFYKRLCESLHVEPSEIVHVGDHPIFDYDTPSGLGIESYCLVSRQTGQSDDISHLNGRQTIRSLRELPGRL